MAPSKKLKIVNKQINNETTPETYIRNSSKSKQRKKKFTDKLGPQWTRGELERFYNSYRKYEGDWSKVAADVRNNRSAEMVEALFVLNRAYLSLPEGTASVAGLLAMMTDHYSVVEESDSEGDIRDASGVRRKHKKPKRVKISPRDVRGEVIPPNSISSAEGCLPLLKQTEINAKERRAARKRTPRFLVPNPYEKDDREGDTLSNKRPKKQLDADALATALTLTDASRRGEGTPYRRTEPNDSTPVKLGKMSQAKEAQFENHDSFMFENGVRISQDRRSKNGAPGKSGAVLMDTKGACNANEGLRFKPHKGMIDFVPSKGKYSLDCSKKNINSLLFFSFVDELEVVEILTGLSALLSRADVVESESLKGERVANNVDEKHNTPQTVSSSHHREKLKEAGPKGSVLHAISAADKRKPKSGHESIVGTDASIGDLGTSRRKLKRKELAEDDDKLKTLVKVRPASQGPTKQLKTAKTLAESSSTSDKKITESDAVVSAIQIPGSVPASLPQKPPHRRKMSLKKSLQERAKTSKTTHDKPHSSDYALSKVAYLTSFLLHASKIWPLICLFHLQESVSNCLSCPLVRRRCIFEWFYSAIDYPWFAKMEFADYLNHVGLGHVPKLTRLEWSVIKSSLGRPRRFSERFLQEERDKLNQYRESVRNHYTEFRAGAREVLPTDIAKPLSVGNRVFAIHPKTREVRDGKILTMDRNKCTVLFDEFGVDLVMDTDCMPLHPLEYMPASLRRQSNDCSSISKEARLSRHPKIDAPVLSPPSVLETASFSMSPPVKQDDIKEAISHRKVIATNSNDKYITTSSKGRGAESKPSLILQQTSDEQEMKPEATKIVNESKSIAQEMVHTAMKAVNSSKKEENVQSMIQNGLNSVTEHHPLDNSTVSGTNHQEHTNGSLDHHHHHQNRSPTNTSELLMTNGSISPDESGNSETQMLSGVITSCISAWLMIQTCTENQYPPGEMAQMMEAAVSSLRPLCHENMPIYRDIQLCIGMIKTQLMSFVRT
ncbi:unnamed protein product [Cochlearia groenlandica]